MAETIPNRKLSNQDRRGDKEMERERKKEEGRARKDTRASTNTEQENRNRKETGRTSDQAHQGKEMINRNRRISTEKTKDYYKQFDTRMTEITKGRQGIAIEGPSRIYAASSGEASSGEWDSEEEAQKEEEKEKEKRGSNWRTRYEDKGSRSSKDSVRDIIAKLTYYIEEDNDIRNEVYEILERTSRKNMQNRMNYNEMDKIKFGKNQQKKK